MQDGDESGILAGGVDIMPVADHLVVAVEHDAFRTVLIGEIDVDRRPFRDGGHVDVVHHLEIGHLAFDDLGVHRREVIGRLDQVRIRLGAGAFGEGDVFRVDGTD